MVNWSFSRVMKVYVIILALCQLLSLYALRPAAGWRQTTLVRTESSSTTALFLTTADFKNGLTLEVNGVPCKIMEFLHVKPGKGSAFVRSKLKNLQSGTTQEVTFRAGESVVAADVYKSDHQFTYIDGDNYMFMNMESFEEVGQNDLLKQFLDETRRASHSLPHSITLFRCPSPKIR